MPVVVYPGSFNPFTHGHANLVERALNLFDKVIVGIGTSVDKDPDVYLSERIELCRTALEGFGDRVAVKGFNGLLVEFVRANNTRFILRGLRTLTDYELRVPNARDEPTPRPGNRVCSTPHGDRMVVSIGN